MGKFYARDALIAQRQAWRGEGKRVVFTNGCYAILHPGQPLRNAGSPDGPAPPPAMM